MAMNEIFPSDLIGAGYFVGQKMPPFPWNLELGPKQYTEDGVLQFVESRRQMFIDDQAYYSGEKELWYIYEQWDMYGVLES